MREVLQEKFDELLVKIGNPNLEHPIFYCTPIGLRFELGYGTPVYLKGPTSDDIIANPQYIAAALQRAKAIYTALPHAPDLLRIDTYPQEADCDAVQGLLPAPQEQISKQVEDGGEPYTVRQLYWELSKIDFSPDLLLREIIKGDLGGISALVSNVYFASTEDIYLYHVYDDRGADLVAERKDTLRGHYNMFNHWILKHDKKLIDTLFAT